LVFFAGPAEADFAETEASAAWAIAPARDPAAKEETSNVAASAADERLTPRMRIIWIDLLLPDTAKAPPSPYPGSYLATPWILCEPLLDAGSPPTVQRITFDIREYKSKLRFPYLREDR